MQTPTCCPADVSGVDEAPKPRRKNADPLKQQVFTKRQVAEMRGSSIATVDRLIKSGKLETIKVDDHQRAARLIKRRSLIAIGYLDD